MKPVCSETAAARAAAVLRIVSQQFVSRRLLVRVTRTCTRTSASAPTSSHRAVMTDAEMTQVVLPQVPAVPLPQVVHRQVPVVPPTRTVPHQRVLAVQLRLVWLPIRTVQ
ncbi:MAG TPA: hypothetical protein DIT89_06045, partial [Planctomycetaceae bacterium]|nr:hypothetical protein [Planctomycetaceae bacterium]